MSADLLPSLAGPTWESAWSTALGALEMDVDAAEALLRADHAVDRPLAVDAPSVLVHAAWRPPVGLGPLPASLVVRARAILDRQLDVARRTAEAANLSRRHLHAVEQMRERPAAAPVYLDIEG